MRTIIFVVALVVSTVSPASPQAAQSSGAPPDVVLRTRWDAIFSQVQQEQGRAVSGAELTGTPTQKAAAYREVIRRLLADRQVLDAFETSDALIQEMIDARTPDDERVWIEKLAEAGAGEKGAKAVNATATNPGAPRAAERSGFTDLVALALDTRNVFAADRNAVSINLNALALVGLNSERMSAPAAYRRLDGLRRIGGTFTFGAKVPEGEITGLTGLPSADALLDAIAWDAKVRVIGDRDPRARRWDRLMVGDVGRIAEIAAAVPAFVPANDRSLVAGLLSDTLGLAAKMVRDRISRSLQVTAKVAGQHLTNEPGNDKYSVAVLGDQGFGDTDLTFNVLYSAARDVTVAPGRLETVKSWRAAVGINTLVAKDLIARGRATELSINATVEVPVGTLFIDRKRTWKTVGGITLPWGDAARIPVSVTFTNDPNNLIREKYVSGYLGISYDFGALRSLFKS